MPDRKAMLSGVNVTILSQAPWGPQDMPHVQEPKLIAGNANQPLAQAIARRMSMHRGKKMGLVDARVERFNDGEIFVEVFENVRGEDMYIIQPTSNPANDNLMELLIMCDALRRSSAARITAVIPYFGYARQDRRTKARTPISSKLVANMLVSAGVERVLTMDLHAAQIQGFFDIPVDNLYASPIFALDIANQFRDRMGDLMIVSPDVGGVARARELAKRLNAPLSIVDKRREKPGEIAEMTVIGDVKDKVALIVDDMCDTMRHPVQSRRSADGKRRQRGAQLYQSRCDERTRGRACDKFGDEIAGDHRHDRTHQGDPGRPQHPRRTHGPDLCTGHPEHLERHFGEFLVRTGHAGPDLRRHVRGRITRAHVVPGTRLRRGGGAPAPSVQIPILGVCDLSDGRPADPHPRHAGVAPRPKHEVKAVLGDRFGRNIGPDHRRGIHIPQADRGLNRRWTAIAFRE